MKKEKIELIDAFSDDEKYVTLKHKKQKKNKREKPIQNTTSDKPILIPIVLLPILVSLYIISTHSNNLITNRLAIFILVLSVGLLIIFISGIIKKIKKHEKLLQNLNRIARFSSFLLIGAYVLGISLSVNMLYMDQSPVKEWLINKAMLTTNHQYIANWFYSDKTINETIAELDKASELELDGSNIIEFDDIDFDQKIYANKYEEEILTKDPNNDIYKIVEVEGKVNGLPNQKYKGWMAVIYDPSKVKLGVSKGAGTEGYTYGQILEQIHKDNKSLVSINAGGFYDPNWRSNGGIPHGAVIKDGILLSEFRRGIDSGGLIGFNKDNKLVLKRMTSDEALKAGIRDAVDWGPYLIVNGKNQFPSKAYTWATSRSVIAQRKDGIVLLLVIDGHQSHSYGASYSDLSSLLLKYGAYNAANLDGGTSTAMYNDNHYVNIPFNGTQRTIRSLPNAWIVVE